MIDPLDNATVDIEVFTGDIIEEAEVNEELTGKRDFGGSTTPKDIRDLWATPQWLFDYFNEIYKFDLDAAANDINHKCDNYLTLENDGTVEEHEWICESAVWCNPPYSDPQPWIEKAINESSLGVLSVMLLPCDPSTEWFHLASKSASKIYILTGGRVQFVRADTGEEQRGNPKGSVLFVFDPNDVDQETIYLPIWEAGGKEPRWFKSWTLKEEEE